MVFIQSQFLGYMLSYFLAIASKHHCFLDTYCFQLLNSCFTIRLNLVINDDMTSILSVDSHVDDSTCRKLMFLPALRAIVPFRAYGIHHLRIACTYDLFAYFCSYALSGYLFYIANFATI